VIYGVSSLIMNKDIMTNFICTNKILGHLVDTCGPNLRTGGFLNGDTMIKVHYSEQV